MPPRGPLSSKPRTPSTAETSPVMVRDDAQDAAPTSASGSPQTVGAKRMRQPPKGPVRFQLALKRLSSRLRPASPGHRSELRPTDPLFGFCSSLRSLTCECPAVAAPERTASILTEMDQNCTDRRLVTVDECRSRIKERNQLGSSRIGTLRLLLPESFYLFERCQIREGLTYGTRRQARPVAGVPPARSRPVLARFTDEPAREDWVRNASASQAHRRRIVRKLDGTAAVEFVEYLPEGARGSAVNEAFVMAVLW